MGNYAGQRRGSGMIKSGVCSVTFRQFEIETVTGLVKEAGLDGIEWGGDVHVPPGDIVAAKKARQVTRNAGLEISSYGSYYFVLDVNGREQDFAPVLESALALGTNTIRIWPGAQPSEVATDDYRSRFVNKIRADLDAAAVHGIRLALEFHVNSLSDSSATALALLKAVNHPNLYTYWQPMYWVADVDYRFQGLEKLADQVLNLHVFQWLFHPMCGGWGDNIERLPLAAGRTEWPRYFSADFLDGDHYALLEFVKDDDPEQFRRDATVLKKWLAG
ncbi:MAG: sugar phosphate isomerase/epimerase family protein [Kiritimatiellales bacterium]